MRIIVRRASVSSTDLSDHCMLGSKEFKSSRPDLSEKQLVALLCDVLFLFCGQGITPCVEPYSGVQCSAEMSGVITANRHKLFFNCKLPSSIPVATLAALDTEFSVAAHSSWRAISSSRSFWSLSLMRRMCC